MPKTFSEYYAEQMAKLSSAHPASARRKPSSKFVDPAAWGTGEAPEEPSSGNPNFWTDPVGATLDFLSRGVYGATNVATEFVDDTISAERKARSGDVGGAVWDAIFNNPALAAISPVLGIAQNIAGESPTAKFGEGLTTDDKTKKRFFSDVIEETTDKVGKEYDPDYIDRVDNVAGPVKGILGFAGDIVLDPLSYVPIPVGPLVKGARLVGKGAGKAVEAAKGLRGAKSVDEVAEASVKAAEEAPAQVPATVGVTPREAMNTPMPEVQRPVAPESVGEVARALDEAESLPIAPTSAKVDDIAENAVKAPATEVAPAVAAVEKAAVRLEPDEIRQAFADISEPLTIPGVKGKVSPQQAREIFLKVASGARTGTRQQAIYKYVIEQATARKAEGATPAPAVAQTPEPPGGGITGGQAVPARTSKATEVSPEAEARMIWDNLAESYQIGETPLTRQHLEQAIRMEREGTLPDEWVGHLGYFREVANIEKEAIESLDALRSELPAVGTPAASRIADDVDPSVGADDAAAKWLAENDVNPTPKAVEHAKKVQGAADEIGASEVLLRASPGLMSMTPEQIIASSGQASRMKAVLDAVESMVKAGRIDEVPARAPIVPGTKGSGYSEEVIADYVASFDYWVANGLSDLADAKGMVSVELASGAEVKVAVEDVRKWLAAIEDADSYVQVDGVWGPAGVGPREHEILQGVDSLFREEIELGYMNPAKEAVEIGNVLDAWQYLIREKNEWLQSFMGEEGYSYISRQMKGNPARVAERMDRLRSMLEPGFGLNDLRNLRNLNRIDETRSVLNMLSTEIPQLGKLIRRALKPETSTWTPPEVARAIDPEPTKVPVTDIEAEEVAEIVTQPSTITPRPSTGTEAQEILDSFNRPSKPQSGKEVGSYRVEVGDDADLSEVFDVAAGELLATVIGRDIHDIPKVAPHKTRRTKANRTHKTPGKGFGWHLKKYNTQNQYTLEQAVYKKAEEISAKVFELQGKGAANLSKTYSMNRAKAFESMYLELRSRVDRALNKLGVTQVIGRAEGLVPLSYFDIFTSIGKDLLNTFGHDSRLPEYVRLMLFSNGQTRVAPTNLMNAVQTALWGGSRSEVLDALNASIKRNGKEFNNYLSGTRKGFHLTLGDSHRAKNTRGIIESVFPRAKFPTTKGNMQWIEIPGEDLANVMADSIMRSVDDLAQKAVNNGWRMEERGLTEVYDMSTAVLKTLDDLYTDPDRMADFMRSVAKIPDEVADEAGRIGAYQDSADTAVDVVTTAVGDDMVSDAEHLVAVDNAIGKTSAKEAVQDSTHSRMKEAMNEADADIDSQRATMMLEGNVMPKVESDDVAEVITGLREQAEIYDYGGKYIEEVQAGTMRALHPWLRRLDVSYNHKRIWGTTHDKALAAQEILNRFRIRVLHIAKKWKQDDIATVWQKIQMNVPVKAGDPLSELHVELKSLISAIWNPGEDALFTNAFLSTEGSIDYVNRIISEKFANAKGSVLQFDIGAAKARSIEVTGTPDQWPNYLAEQWRAMKVDDPLDFIQRMSDAAVTIAERRAVVESFLHNAAKWGAISNKPKPGFVRLNVTGAENTSFGVMLAQSITKKRFPNGLFIEKELAKELRHADYLTTASRSLTGAVGDFVNKTYMPVLNAWKIAITIYRPGHHVRTMIGDSSLTWVARGNRYYAKSAKDAFKVMAMRNDYSDVDLMRSLRALEGMDAQPPRQGDVLIRGSLNGEKVELTAGQIMSLLHTKGLRPTFHMGEGYFEDAVLASRTATIARKMSFQDTKFNEIAGGLSQYRDHFSRAQHFMQILNQELSSGGPFSGKQFRNVKDLEDLFDRAAAEVKKYHPDASMLTPWESKYARPVIPFYSWFAKILPAIVESTLRRPGRVTVFPKASYELAVATGVNPDTIYDPFPEDQLFPSFITEKALGPQFKDIFGQGYVGLNPGIAHLDVFNTLGPDPVGGILGMTTPFLRVPLELRAGSSLSTGARINDASDYLDSSIPGVNYLANFTGISPTGTLGSILSGAPALDPQYQVARGNKGGAGSEDAWMAMMNWATGLGFQDMSRPNYINYAELEKKRGEVP